MSFLQHFEATCPKLYILSSPCHFQCENLPTCPDVQLPLDSRGGKNIPRDLVTRNFLNLNEFWEFVKMCETSPKVNNGKFLKALVSPVADTGHTWQKQNLWEIKYKVKVMLEDKQEKTPTRTFKANTAGKQREEYNCKVECCGKMVEKYRRSFGDVFSSAARVLTIGCKDNMFSIKVTLSGDDLQPAMTCTHSVKNIGHIPQGKETSLRYSF